VTKEKKIRECYVRKENSHVDEASVRQAFFCSCLVVIVERDAHDIIFPATIFFPTESNVLCSGQMSQINGDGTLVL
jgi:hypothetical protein